MNADSWVGVVIGVVMGFIRINNMANSGPMWMYKWFRLTKSWGEDGVVRRLRFALSKFDRLLLLRFSSPLKWFLLLMFLAWAVNAPINSNYAMAYAGTYTGLGCVAILVGLFKKYRLRLKTYAAHEAVHRLGADLANELVIPFALASRRAYRLPAIQALRALGTPSAIAALRTLALDKDRNFANAAQVALDDLERLYAGRIRVMSVEPIAEHAQIHSEILKRFAKTRTAWHLKDNKTKTDALSDEIDAIVFSQLPLRRAFPDVYCKLCYARAEHHTYEGWEWINCRRCKQVHGLVPGIQEVVGQIGADEDWKVADGILKLNLWNDASRHVRIADIDALEIVGGKSIQYEWAIAAVVQSLQKQNADPEVKFPVRISLDPPLDANSHRLLKTLERVDGHSPSPQIRKP